MAAFYSQSSVACPEYIPLGCGVFLTHVLDSICERFHVEFLLCFSVTFAWLLTLPPCAASRLAERVASYR